jgi:hypothetical protein
VDVSPEEKVVDYPPETEKDVNRTVEPEILVKSLYHASPC